MSKFVILGDTHLGARNDSSHFHDFMERFYLTQFFPYMEEHKLDTIVQLGDLFDRRKFINFHSLYRAKKYFFDQLRERKLKLYVLAGNHDLYFKNTLDVNSLHLLLNEYSDCIKVFTSPQDLVIYDTSFAVVPWICQSNYQETFDYISKTDSQLLFGHLELSGFEMYRGSPCEHGMDRHTFDKFDMVMTGHFHHKSHYGNIYYLGTPYELTWSDWGDPKGFHVFDVKDRSLIFVENNHQMFHKIFYDDTNTSLEELMEQDFSNLEHHIVKVIVRNKTNPYWFDMFIKKIEDIELVNLQIVEDNLNLSFDDESDLEDGIEDTITILNKYTEQFKDKVNVSKLNTFLLTLYHDALALE